MGTDIHLHTEIKVNGVWQHYSQPRIPRDYRLFAKLANVRNHWNIVPIAEPRGLPDDVTFTTKFDANRWDDDGHDHSWLTGVELASALAWYDTGQRKGFSSEHEFFGYLFGNGWGLGAQCTEHQDCRENETLGRACARAHDDSWPPEVEDVRAVFWFDC
jgi:hypothetical protein